MEKLHNVANSRRATLIGLSKEWVRNKHIFGLSGQMFVVSNSLQRFDLWGKDAEIACFGESDGLN